MRAGEEDSLTSKSHELDLTSHHDTIINGIQGLKKIYKLTTNEAKKRIEKSYTARSNKIPNIIPFFQEITTNIKSYIIYMNKSKGKSKFTFNLLKCTSTTGISWVEIEGFSNSLTLSFNPPNFSYTQNSVGEIFCKVMATKEVELFRFSFDYCKKLAKISVDQIAKCKDFTLFENHKTNEVDCCFYVTLELSAKDRIRVLKQKYQDTQNFIDKLRLDAQGTGIENEFKPSCCDCVVF